MRSAANLGDEGAHRALDKPNVRAEHDEAVATRDHRLRLGGGERNAAQCDARPSEDLRLGLGHHGLEAWVIELSGYPEILGKITARNAHTVNPIHGDDVVETVDGCGRLDQHDVEDLVIRDPQVL